MQDKQGICYGQWYQRPEKVNKCKIDIRFVSLSANVDYVIHM